MRRCDREVSDIAEIKKFLAEQKIIRVGFCDGGEVYIVPVNYGHEYCGEKPVFYFHGAMAGRKYELAVRGADVGFEIDGEYDLITADTACGYSAHYKSVIGTGRLTVIENNDEKIHALDRIMEQASGRTENVYSGKMLDATAVFKLEASSMTCKAR